MLTFALGGITVAEAGLLEVFTLAQARLLAVELGDLEVSLSREDIVVLLLPMAARLVLELAGSRGAAVGHEHLRRNRSDRHLVRDRLYRCEVRVSDVHVRLCIAAPLAFLARAVALVLDVRPRDPVVAVARVRVKRHRVRVVALDLAEARRLPIQMLGQRLQHLPFEEAPEAQLRLVAYLLALSVLHLLLGHNRGGEQQSQSCCESHYI